MTKLTIVVMSIWIKTAMVYDKSFVVSSMKVIYDAENEKKPVFMSLSATCFLLVVSA